MARKQASMNNKNRKIPKSIIFVFLGALSLVLIIYKIFSSLNKSRRTLIRGNKSPVYSINIRSKGNVTVALPEDDYEYIDDEDFNELYD